MKTKLNLAVALLSMGCLTAMAEDFQVCSPDKQIVVTISDAEGVPTYQVSYKNQVFLEKSPLGLKTNFNDLTTGLTMGDCTTTLVEDHYLTRNIKQQQVD